MFNLKGKCKLVGQCGNCHAGILENEEGQKQCVNNYTHCDYSLDKPVGKQYANFQEIINNDIEIIPHKDNKSITIKHNYNYADMPEMRFPEKVGGSEKEIEDILKENNVNNNYIEKTAFEIITGINPDAFAKLYQAGIITIKENISSLANLINEYGIEETINIFNAKKGKE